LQRKSILSWVGGKSKLSSQIIELMPEHHCYCEVFAGAAWVLFRKSESRVEIINDLNADLVTLYRVVRHHLDEFVRCLRWLLVARDEFDVFVRAKAEDLTDIQRAVRFYYLVRIGYGGRANSHHVSFSTQRAPGFNLLRLEEDLSQAHLRLARVQIERKSYQEFIKRYDRDNVFFYVDPPYHGCEDYYGKGMFGEEDFGALQDILSGIKGQFMMSINDTPLIRELFGEFCIREAKVKYTLGSSSGKQNQVTELLIMNYEPPV